MTRSNPPSLLIAPMTRGDLAQLTPQAQQISVKELISEDYDRWLLQGGPAFSVRRGDGGMVACLGVVEQWDGRGMGWAVMDKDAGRSMLPLTRAVRAFFQHADFRRIEFYIDHNFPQGRRWMGLLGCKLETPEPMQNFYINSNAAYLYSLVK